MTHSDTIDKIVTVYIGGLCRQAFSYKDHRFEPSPVYVSPLLLRGYTCPPNCGACCGSFSLDYLPGEKRPRSTVLRSIIIDGREVAVSSDLQNNAVDRWCRYLHRDTGRCTIYAQRPFACDFELIRLLRYENRVVVTQKQYGRSWAMMRLDDERGALCEMLPPDKATVAEVVRKFRRLQEWAEHVRIRTCVPSIIDWVRGNCCDRPLQLAADEG